MEFIYWKQNKMNNENLPTTIEELLRENANLRQENEELNRLASFPQLNPNPVIEFDRNGQVTFINPAALQVLSNIGLSDARLFLPEDFMDMCKVADGQGDLSFHKEVNIGELVFEETINFPQKYGTVRIYASDIAQRKLVENTLHQSEEKYRTLYETMAQGVIYFDAAMQIVSANPAAERILGVTLDQMTGRTIMDPRWRIIQEDGSDLPSELRPAAVALRSGVPVNDVTMGIYNPRLDDFTWVIANAVPLFEQGSDKPYQVYSTFEDITGRKKTEEALRVSEQRFRMVLKNAPVTVAAQDKDLHFIWAYNQRTVNPTDLLGKTDSDLFPAEVATWLMGLKRQILETGTDLREQGWITSNGQRLYLDLFLEPIRDERGQINGVGIATVDLTEMKLAQTALEESEAQYRSLFEGMTEGFAIHEIICAENGEPFDYRFLDVNPAFEQLTGLKREDIVGKTYRQVLPDEGDNWINTFGKVALIGEPVEFENYSPSLNKHYEVFAYRCAPRQFAAIFLDITERKRMEVELRINLMKYSALFESLPIGVTVSDQNGKILETNQEASRLLGMPEKEQKSRQIDGHQWQIIRSNGTPMPPEEYASVRALKEQRRIENVEMGIAKDDGQVTWISVTAAPLPLEDYGVIIAYNDITQRVSAEEALRKAHNELEITVQQRTKELLESNKELEAEISERKRIESQLLLQTEAVEAERQRFNNVLEMLPAYLILLTPDYHASFANRYFRDRFGESHGRPCYEYLFGLNEPCENCETYKVLQTGTPHNWEWTGPDKRNYDVFDFPFTDVDGSNLILEMGIDITDQKQAEEKLRLSNAYNRSLLESSLDILATITSDGKIGDVNAATEVVTGFTRQQLIGTDFHSYFTDPEKTRAGYRQVFETGTVRDYELEIQHKDGHTTPVFYNASVYRDEAGNVAGVFAVARDITERKRTERQLILLTTALEAAANGIIVTDKNGRILWSNPAFSRMTGYNNEEIIGQNPRFLKSGKQDPSYYQELWTAICAGNVWHGELINLRKDGSLYDEEQIITPVLDQGGNITNFISIKQDITDHKLAEEALRTSEEQYRSLVIATAQIVWKTDPAGEVVEDIPTWRAFSGQSEAEILGQGWIDALHPSDRQRVAEIWAHAVETKTLYDTECRIKHLSGEYYHFEVRAVPVKDKDGNISGWIGTCTDITEKKQFETQLIQAEKHAVIGRMVGSVTHEINNPLQTIKNCLYLINQDIPSDSPLDEPLRMASSETQRLTNLVAQLRQLYRPQTNPIKHPHELLDIIEEVHSLVLHHLNNSNVVWQQSAELKRCFISCVRDQIIEVLLNISMNAIEAMQPRGGIISIDMLQPIDKDQVGVIISDNGPGFDKDVLPHIFEPFTTTKINGLGLGLSICYGIIQRHGGQILAESQPGRGTTFTIWLPLATQSQEIGE